LETELIVNINLQALPDKELRQLEQQIATEWRSRLATVPNGKATETSTTPALRPDPIIDAYKRDVDRTLIRANLKLSVQERLENLMKLQQFAEELRKAGKKAQK
jgi:hypothetical protein